MDNPQGNCTIDKQNKNTTQYVLDTDNVNKTRALLQATGGQDEQNIVEIIYQVLLSNEMTFPSSK
jgi:hypothetical protein